MPGKRGVVLTVVAAAYGMSSMGDQMTIVSLTLRLHDQGRSGVAISALVIASVLPLVVIGPLAAPLVDRVENSRLIVVVTVLQALVSVGLVFVTGLAGTLRYDEEFFQEKKDTFLAPEHLAMYAHIGAGEGAVRVTHWQKVD